MTTEDSVDFVIYQYSGFERFITCTNDDGTPIDITGYTFQSQVRKEYSSPDVLFSFSFEILEAEEGKLRMYLPSNFYTRQLKAPINVVYDVKETAPDSEPEVMFSGVIRLKPVSTL